MSTQIFSKAVNPFSVVNCFLLSGSDHVLNQPFAVYGQKERALSLLKRSFEINPRGEANPGSLNGTAYAIAGIGQNEGALNLLLVAVELFPNEANLFDSVGEFYLKLKQTENAIVFYSKALEIDPNYANAKSAREILEKLKAK